MARSTASLLPVRRVATFIVASQTSAQSMHVRMHCRMSISSPEQASAHDVQITEQNIA